MLLAQHDRDHISLHCVEELLRDVVGAYGVLEGQVEHVVSLHHVPTLVFFGTPGTDPDTRTIKSLSENQLLKEYPYLSPQDPKISTASAPEDFSAVTTSSLRPGVWQLETNQAALDVSFIVYFPTFSWPNS